MDDVVVGSTRLERTVAFIYHATDWLDIAEDNGVPVTEHYGTPGGRCTAEIERVHLETDTDKADDAAGRLRAQMAVQ